MAPPYPPSAAAAAAARLLLFSVLIAASFSCSAAAAGDVPRALTLDSVRESLIRQEDSIVFSLLERAMHRRNSAAYDSSFLPPASLAEFFVRQSEIISAKAGRYLNPEEVPFFPDYLPEPLVHPHSPPQVLLHPASATVNVSKEIWRIYTREMVALFTEEGDDGDHGSTVASDLVLLQALSRRIHYGRFVAEVKFRDAPDDYIPLIKSKDRVGLMELLTFADVEESVKRRVEKKAMLFGQNVTLDDKAGRNNTGGRGKYKVDPEVAARIYGEWVIPLTKLVQVEYLLRRLH
ncbi:unnamed protein product [Spirodela intermedia]|uniref:Chorismate mutase n=1 Tax=Spirodela intermedia TaxID=51605 RepID=A0A7I8LCD2_SPIIN|nr:unnamed protein product [Spirodela intermedia]